jgi:hypothetical protein
MLLTPVAKQAKPGVGTLHPAFASIPPLTARGAAGSMARRQLWIILSGVRSAPLVLYPPLDIHVQFANTLRVHH